MLRQNRGGKADEDDQADNRREREEDKVALPATMARLEHAMRALPWLGLMG